MADEIFCYQSHPLRHMRKIGSITVKVAGEGPVPFDHMEIRATFEHQSNAIVLTGFPSRNEGYVDTKSSREDSEAWLEHVLAHEVCHSEQFAADSSLFEPGHPGDEASKRGQKAAQTREASDYMRYLEHELEFEAHAVQLAVQVLRNNPTLDEHDFDTMCQSMHLYRHISEKAAPKGGCNTQPNRLTNYLQRLVAEAWRAYQRLT